MAIPFINYFIYLWLALIKQRKRQWGGALIALVCLLTLTGCPGVGDRIRPDEEAILIMEGDSVCLVVHDSGDYKPVDISINPRGMPSREQDITFDPALRITNGKLCIPPDFYTFPQQGQFIIESVLKSKKYPDEPRNIVTGLAIVGGHVAGIRLSDDEIIRP